MRPWNLHILVIEYECVLIILCRSHIWFVYLSGWVANFFFLFAASLIEILLPAIIVILSVKAKIIFCQCQKSFVTMNHYVRPSGCP